MAQAGAPALPAEVARALDDLVLAARDTFGPALRAVVLFGSAAEGRLRATSDVNVIVVLSSFDPGQAGAMAGHLRMLAAAVRLAPMFLLEAEIPAAARAFAAKFADIRRRRRVLWGDDVFASLAVPREAEIARVRQVLLNLLLRLRAVAATETGHDERLTAALADTAGPLRAAAAALLEIEGRPVPQPKEALATVAAESGDFAAALEAVSAARERREVRGGTGDALAAILDLAARLHARAEGLR